MVEKIVLIKLIAIFCGQSSEMRFRAKFYFVIIERAATCSLQKCSKMKVTTVLIPTHKKIDSKRCLFSALECAITKMLLNALGRYSYQHADIAH